MRPMFGAQGSAVGPTSIAFVSKPPVADVKSHHGLNKMVEAARLSRLGKADMVLNDTCPEIKLISKPIR